MDSRQLDSLVKIGQLKAEPFSQSEDDTYLRSANERLKDATAAEISLSSKFLLGYGAAYSLPPIHYHLPHYADVVTAR